MSGFSRLGHPGGCCCPGGGGDDCGWSLTINAYDVGDMDPVSGVTYVLGVVPTELESTVDTTVTISAPGYHDRCMTVHLECGVETVLDADMYPEETWIKNLCCGCEPTEEGTRPRDMLPKFFQLRILVPEGVSGTVGEVTFTIYYNDTRSDDLDIDVWDTGCLEGQGGWGTCPAHGYSYTCQISTAPGEPCTTTAGSYGADQKDHILYHFTRVSLFVPRDGEVIDPCPATVRWDNWWIDPCDDSTTPGDAGDLTCDDGISLARPVAKLCTVAPGCDCGMTPISGPFPSNIEPVGTALNYYPTSLWIIPVSPLCGTPVHAEGVYESSDDPLDTENPVYFDCFGVSVLGSYAIVEEL